MSRAHEWRVLALLSGQTQEGRKERAALEGSFAGVSGIALAGTVTAGGDTRTYVTLTTGKGQVLGWFAVNDHGGVQAAEVPAKPPGLTFAPSGRDRFRPDDPTGTGPQVDAAFEDDRMVITTAQGTATTAERAG